MKVVFFYLRLRDMKFLHGAKYNKLHSIKGYKSIEPINPVESPPQAWS